MKLSKEENKRKSDQLGQTLHQLDEATQQLTNMKEELRESQVEIALKQDKIEAVNKQRDIIRAKVLA